MAGNVSNNSSLNLMSKRLGILFPRTKEELEAEIKKGISQEKGVQNVRARFEGNGGHLQQDRMIFDKLRTLDRAVLYSYQAANINHIGPEREELPVRALINPNKLKQDYDDKILSVRYDYNFKPGDILEWHGTGSYWIVYLQDLEELAYFRSGIRRCSYEIAWQDEDGEHITYAAVRGPVETKIDYIQKHTISIDNPNHSLNILIPKNDETLKYFKRYQKFYLRGSDPSEPQVCWRIEAIDWISTPGILEVNAVEYYINETEDDVDNGIVGGLKVETLNPNTISTENTILGNTFIKPRISYTYEYAGDGDADWSIDNKYPIEKTIDGNKITLKWVGNFSGQFILASGDIEKTIVVESLF